MVSVADHYATHLASIYLWMAGGLDVALGNGAKDLAGFLPGTGLAVDLGAGFGMHSIVLARAGYRVLALDTSAELLRILDRHGAGLKIQTVEKDLLGFRRNIAEPAQLVVCMGDTLTHLQTLDEVRHLCAEVADILTPTGSFITTFRDYSLPATGDRRFIPVRSDADRILTCFLEAFPEHMVVHDLIHERTEAQWSLKVSSYRKLRLPPAMVKEALGAAGLTVQVVPGPRGMVQLTARHPT